ncbi:phosphatase 2C 51-like protein [Raphidocelis subcapitata]|uniref:protein-serine/threonine phosphatase n=1 Tax=Raphidocelis subcapitata TaxID=307507 RepID=A0A2V0NRA3_9CHLO|nr:phosphatase 2C 51-like protein [Raphidocelis subcapitata]|eukprot:GBF87365.1 phosphatase 2C 51-like protein [Raphidocelis subcapitata]
MASARTLERNHSALAADAPVVGCRLVMDSRLSAGSDSLADALRQRTEQGGLPSCPEGHPSLVPAPASSLSASLPPAHPESGSGSVGSARRGSAGGASQHSGSFHAGTPRTPLSAEYAAALARNSQRLLEAVASSASSGLGGSAENPVPLPEQETLMLPLAATQGAASPQDRVRAAAKAAAEAGEVPPERGAPGTKHQQQQKQQHQQQQKPQERRKPPASPAPAGPAAAAAVAADDGEADAEPDGAAAGEGAAASPDPCSCPPFAVKATCGKRPIMEDTYASCPNICELPMPPMAADFADKLPQRIAVQLANGEPSAEPGDAAAALAAPAAAPGRGAAAAAVGADEPIAPTGSAFGGAVDSAGALEKLHFFGVYDGHGGIQASQHCAARLHHHLSVCLRDMVLGAAPGSNGGAAAAAAVVPEVQFVSIYRSAAEGPAVLSPLGGGDDCLIAVAAAAAAAAEANGGKLASVSSAPEVSPEDEAALRALSRESSGTDREKAAAERAGEEGEEAEGEGDGDDDAASADGSEGTSVCALLEEALREAFLKTDEEFSADGTAGLVGSTAVCALVGTHRVWIANCGDSRAVLCRGGQAVQVTDDHKPEREDEAERVEKAGGQVLYWNGHRVMGVLAMSRAIGDHCLRPYVIPEPEITVFRRHARDEILLLASDGLWDVMPNQEATDLAMRCIRRARDKGASPKAAARVAATILTKAAVDRGSRDNITVMVIDLSRSGAAAAARGGDDGDDADEAPKPAAAPAPAARPAGGRLAAAAAAAEAAAATGKRPVPQRIITEQPSVAAGPGAVAAAQQQQQQQQGPGEQQQQQQQQEAGAEAALGGEASIIAPGARPSLTGGPFGRPAASPFVAPDALAGAVPLPAPFAAAAAAASALAPEPQQQQEEEPSPPVTAQRQGSTSPFSAFNNLAPFEPGQQQQPQQQE